MDRVTACWPYLDEERRWFDLDAASASSIGAMSISVLDTYSAMRRILLAPVADRVDLLGSMLEPTRGMYRYHPGEVDLVAMHLAASGFPSMATSSAPPASACRTCTTTRSSARCSPGSM
ncbi:hypothetical protein Misp01_78300 [Microtetraspora sp. NBRC 13810]|nr:hypothetical protein Misp01_78300 [Microtetraspora sp. NBRC 13810]